MGRLERLLATNIGRCSLCRTSGCRDPFNPWRRVSRHRNDENQSEYSLAGQRCAQSSQSSLEAEPELVNEVPQAEGWLVLIEPSAWAAERFKLDLQSYDCYTEGQKFVELDRTEIFTDLVFRPRIVVKANSSDPERVLKQINRALESAQKYSLVANSVKSTITLEPEIEVLL